MRFHFEWIIYTVTLNCIQFLWSVNKLECFFSARREFRFYFLLKLYWVRDTSQDQRRGRGLVFDIYLFLLAAILEHTCRVDRRQPYLSTHVEWIAGLIRSSAYTGTFQLTNARGLLGSSTCWKNIDYPWERGWGSWVGVSIMKFDLEPWTNLSEGL